MQMWNFSESPLGVMSTMRPMHGPNFCKRPVLAKVAHVGYAPTQLALYQQIVVEVTRVASSRVLSFHVPLGAN